MDPSLPPHLPLATVKIPIVKIPLGTNTDVFKRRTLTHSYHPPRDHYCPKDFTVLSTDVLYSILFDKSVYKNEIQMISKINFGGWTSRCFTSPKSFPVGNQISKIVLDPNVLVIEQIAYVSVILVLVLSMK